MRDKVFQKHSRADAIHRLGSESLGLFFLCTAGVTLFFAACALLPMLRLF